MTGLSFTTTDTLTSGTSCSTSGRFLIGLVRDSDWSAAVASALA